MTKAEELRSRFVLTYNMCKGEVCGCIGVYNKPQECLGAILKNIINEMDSCEPYENEKNANEFTMKWMHDDSNDNFYQFTVTYKGCERDPDIYRVYYLRDE